MLDPCSLLVGFVGAHITGQQVPPAPLTQALHLEIIYHCLKTAPDSGKETLGEVPEAIT